MEYNWSDGCHDLAIDGEDNLYICTYQGALYRSEDDGKSWTKIYQSSTNSPIDEIAISPAGDIFTTNYKVGILRSTDRGLSWKLVKEDRERIPIYVIIINKKGEIFINGSNDKIYRSRDNGESWEDITLNLSMAGYSVFYKYETTTWFEYLIIMVGKLRSSFICIENILPIS